jgi:general stress protein YciG
MASSSNTGTERKGRGFASMDKDRQREIASEGGRAAHQSGNAHEFTSEEARRAGQQSHRARQKNTGGSSADSEAGGS